MIDVHGIVEIHAGEKREHIGLQRRHQKLEAVEADHGGERQPAGERRRA